MRACSARQRGISLVEVLIASGVSLAVLIAAGRVLLTTSDLAESSTSATTSELRADRVLWSVLRDVRRCSLGSVTHLDSTPFQPGEEGSALSFQLVERWDGPVAMGPRIEVAWVVPVGATVGQVERRQDGRAMVLARGVSAFRVHRDGDRLRFALTTVTGPADDRARSVTYQVGASPRNP